MFSPGLSFDIKRVDVTKGDAGVVQTTMATIDVYFSIVVAGTSVGSGSWSADS